MIETFKKRIEDTLKQVTDLQSPFFSSLYEGGRYALLAPGKRIRPLLTLLAAEMVEEEGSERALYPACALEMVHTYSLIHDDLPAMDDDDFRRGRPTLHRVYSEGHAILVGDHLLTSAFEVLADAPDLGASQKVALIRALAKAAGAEGMIGGQIMDIEQSPLFHETHLRKTAALFRASLEFGGIVMEVSPPILHLFGLFGTQLGLLFQIVDDILDEDGPLESNEAYMTMHMRHTEALQTLEALPYNTQFLTEVTNWVAAQAHKTLRSSL